MQLKLITWNVHGLPWPLSKHASTRIAAIANVLADKRPDFICLQELWRPQDADYLQQELGAEYQLVGPPGWVLPVEPRTPIIGQLFLPLGLFIRLRRSGLLALVRRDWRIVGEPRFEPYLAEASDAYVLESDGQGDKGFQTIEVASDNGQHVVLFNTHLQSRYGCRSYDLIRAQQVTQLNAAAAAVGADLPVLCAGDFNLAPCCLNEPLCADNAPGACSEPGLYQYIVGTWNDLTEALRADCTECGIPRHCRTNFGDKDWIDYVLARRSSAWAVKGQLQLLQNDSSDNPYSDHDGLYAELEIEPVRTSLATVFLAAAVAADVYESSRRGFLTHVAMAGAARFLAPLRTWIP